MEKGKIIEDGTHPELMSLNGKYAEAFMLQAKGYESKTAEV
jgi:ATP-binding cassette subfamily B protein